MLEVVIVLWVVVWVVSVFLSSVLMEKIDKLPIDEDNYKIVEVNTYLFYILGPIGLVWLVLIYLLRLNVK